MFECSAITNSGLTPKLKSPSGCFSINSHSVGNFMKIALSNIQKTNRPFARLQNVEQPKESNLSVNTWELHGSKIHLRKVILCFFGYETRFEIICGAFSWIEKTIMALAREGSVYMWSRTLIVMPQKLLWLNNGLCWFPPFYWISIVNFKMLL